MGFIKSGILEDWGLDINLRLSQFSTHEVLSVEGILYSGVSLVYLALIAIPSIDTTKY